MPTVPHGSPDLGDDDSGGTGPLPGARIENMMFVESAGAGDQPLSVGTDSRGASIQLLGVTPGSFPARSRPSRTLSSRSSHRSSKMIDARTSCRSRTSLFSTSTSTRVSARSSRRSNVTAFRTVASPEHTMTDTGSTFFSAYQPVPLYVQSIPSDLVPKENVDFEYPGAYSLYNWELFFHVPFLVATQLSKLSVSRRPSSGSTTYSIRPRPTRLIGPSIPAPSVSGGCDLCMTRRCVRCKRSTP